MPFLVSESLKDTYPLVDYYSLELLYPGLMQGRSITCSLYVCQICLCCFCNSTSHRDKLKSNIASARWGVVRIDFGVWSQIIVQSAPKPKRKSPCYVRMYPHAKGSTSSDEKGTLIGFNCF
ncbi:hypothetical protein F2Q69_00033845 [Brassica cretica]|uniref:Uncharacterized protein n=1 Tax=Brassica cretica TaxID=69181 RepID=A0A8S9SD38_BRACR|nr:hypothetical protein F2Q69_00033845 [Brassica cretica]